MRKGEQITYFTGFYFYYLAPAKIRELAKNLIKYEYRREIENID